MKIHRGFSWSAVLVGVLLLLSLIASACGGKPASTPTPTRTPKPTFTPTPAVAAQRPVQPQEKPMDGKEPMVTATPTRVQRPTATPIPPTPTPVPRPYVLVEAKKLNVRTGPGVRYPAIGSVGSGQRLDIVGKNAQGTWWKVCCVNGRRGWLSAEFVKAGGDLKKVVVAVAPPPPTPRPRPTNTPTPQPTKPPYKFSVAKLEKCEPNAGITYVNGMVYIDHHPANGYIVVFSWTPDGPYDDILGLPSNLNDLGCVSYKSGCAGNRDAGKWSHILQQGKPREGEWYFWIVDTNTRRRISAIAHVHTDGTAGPGKCQQAFVVFDTQ